MRITPDEVAALADELLRLGFEREPVNASMYGVPGYDDRLADPSAAAEADHRRRALDVAARAESALAGSGQQQSGQQQSGQDTSSWDQDAVTLAVTAQQARAMADQIDSRMVEYTITDLFIAPAANLLTILPMTLLPTPERADAYLARLRAIPAYLAATAERHREGVAAERVPVAHLVRAAITHLDRYLENPGADSLRRPTPPAEMADSFAAARERVLTGVVRPAFAAYREVLATEIAPHARPEDKPGLCWLPDGDTVYAALSRVHTTTDRTADDLHRTGLELMDRLAGEFAEIGSRVFGSTDVQEIFQRLRTDPRLRWRDGEELLAAARTAIERAEAEAPRWFGRLAAQGCNVEPVPATEAPGAPVAYYMPPSLDGQRPGTYFANTYQPEERHRHVAEVAAFHEGVPGHHFQASIAAELTELPLLRRLAEVNAYVEGWGLYCERLADEMGLYSGDVDRLGMLAMDAVRAGRLVVDTGLHAKGWSRRQAVDYMTEHVPMPALEISTEIDRYIAFPGQALSYMVGRLEIQRIRAEATARLGGRFDIRRFHDLVLGGGPLPLTVLDQVITAKM